METILIVGLVAVVGLAILGWRRWARRREFRRYLRGPLDPRD